MLADKIYTAYCRGCRLTGYDSIRPLIQRFKELPHVYQTIWIEVASECALLLNPR